MASDEQFSLCWNNFHANMSAGFHGLLSRGDLVDVTLAAEGRLLQAHKLVLSVCSPYFQEMFKMNPSQHPIVFLKDVSHSALRDLLQFMYQGEVNVKQEELASFISTAEQLQVKGLTGNQNEESSTPSKPKPTSRPGPRSSQQRQVMTKLETDIDTKPSSTPVAIKRPNRPSIASNNSSSSQSGPTKRKCVDPLEAGPSGSAKEEFVTIPDEDENNAVAPKMEPEFVNESMWDEDDDGTNNDDTNFGEEDSNMDMTGFDGSTGDGNVSGTGEGGAVGDAQDVPQWVYLYFTKNSEEAYQCSVCDSTVEVTEGDKGLLDHMTISHNEIYELHKKHPDHAMGFQIQFLEVDVLNKSNPIIVGEMCEPATEEIITEKDDVDYVIMPQEKESVDVLDIASEGTSDVSATKSPKTPKRRSWVWKYFEKMAGSVYRCALCHVILTINGRNTNNLNRHVRTRHPTVFNKEVTYPSRSSSVRSPTVGTSDLCYGTSSDGIYDEKGEESDKAIAKSRSTSNLRRSKVWTYFSKLSDTMSQCVMCERKICHGGHATGNMNRHMRVMHNISISENKDNGWVWKVFKMDSSVDYVSCKICQFRVNKSDQMDTTEKQMLGHLKTEHGVYSSDQIITTS